MTRFELVTQDADHLANFVWGLLEQTESDILDTIFRVTGIEIDRITLSPELRIAGIKSDLLQEVDDDT